MLLTTLIAHCRAVYPLVGSSGVIDERLMLRSSCLFVDINVTSIQNGDAISVLR